MHVILSMKKIIKKQSAMFIRFIKCSRDMRPARNFMLLVFVTVCIGLVLLGERYVEGNNISDRGEVDNQGDVNPNPDTSTSQKSYKNIRVLLTNSSDSSYKHYSVKLRSEVPMQVTGAEYLVIPANTTFDISEILDKGESIRVIPVEDGASITVESLKKGGVHPRYEGVMEIQNIDGVFRLINEVSLETYVRYVVPSEMPSNYPLEALKTQAICARTYAVYHMTTNRLESYNADVDDTTMFQVYAHIAPQESTNQAARETKGKIMTYNGKPVQAYFFSTSCGFTSGVEIWGNREYLPYLRAMSLSVTGKEETEVFSFDTGITSDRAFENHMRSVQSSDLESSEPWYRWSVTFSWEEIQSRVNRKYSKIGALKEIEVLERSTGGAVLSVRLVGETGTATIDTESEVRSFFAPRRNPLILLDGTELNNQSTLPSPYIYFSVGKDGGKPTTLSVNGGGYGHGIGMSQNASKRMAENGLRMEQIVRIFYYDIDITDIS